MARAITGHVPRYRTGHGVRTALRAAGAHAATVDGTLHLPGPPDASPASMGLLAHELTHVAERGHHGHSAANDAPVRPRFFLERLSGAVDTGERQARRVGEMVRERASQAVPSGLPGTARHPSLPAVPALPGLGDWSPPDLAALPVGGPAAALSAARQALGDAAGARDAAMSRAGDALGAGSAALPAAANSALGALARQAGDTGGLPAATAGTAASTLSGVGGLADTATAGLQAAVGQAASSAGDLDSRIGALMEAVEDRLLAELERRGGRYAGVF
jgi:hypothetical protein